MFDRWIKLLIFKFLNPGMTKRPPLQQKIRQNNAITRLLDVISHGPGKTKRLGGI